MSSEHNCATRAPPKGAPAGRHSAAEVRIMASCPECGAASPDGRACIDLFHAMLLLEHEVAADPAESSGARSEAPPFHAVSSYVLQHPDSMNYTAEALAGVRRSVADHLAGRAT